MHVGSPARGLRPALGCLPRCLLPPGRARDVHGGSPLAVLPLTVRAGGRVEAHPPRRDVQVVAADRGQGRDRNGDRHVRQSRILDRDAPSAEVPRRRELPDRRRDRRYPEADHRHGDDGQGGSAVTATVTASVTPKLGVAVNEALLIPDPAARRRILDHIAGAGLDHVTTGDHISFQGGTGFDGLVSATSILAANDTLKVLIGVYLAGLRHPVVTARQLATISQRTPAWPPRHEGAGWTRRSRYFASWPPARPSTTRDSFSHSATPASCPRRTRGSRWSSAARATPPSGAPPRTAMVGWASSARLAGSVKPSSASATPRPSLGVRHRRGSG